MEVNGNIDDFLQGFAARPEKKNGAGFSAGQHWSRFVFFFLPKAWSFTNPIQVPSDPWTHNPVLKLDQWSFQDSIDGGT